jgi:hypothetical protein
MDEKALAAAAALKVPESVVVNGQVVDGDQLKKALTGGGGISKLIAESAGPTSDLPGTFPAGPAFVSAPAASPLDESIVPLAAVDPELVRLNGAPAPGSYDGPPQPIRSIYRGIRFQSEEEAAAWVAFVSAAMPTAESMELADKNADILLASYKMRRGDLDRAAKAKKAI